MPTACACAAARPAALINQEIRQLAARAVLTDQERARLAELWQEYGDATGADEA